MSFKYWVLQKIFHKIYIKIRRETYFVFQKVNNILSGRFIIGINSGANMAIAPMYLTEIAPLKYRGRFGTLGQLGVVSTILISQVWICKGCKA